MLKENGRLEPADQKEVAKLKGKLMVCSVCGEKAYISDVEFANTLCEKCGNQMVDQGSTNAKLTGKIQ